MLSRIIFVGIMLGLWFLTQWLIGNRGPQGSGIQDKVHIWTQAWNAKLQNSKTLTKWLLISSSLGIDCLGVYLIYGAIFGASVAPFVGLVIIFALRQLSQFLTALPTPDGMIWTHPGVPSLLVTYGVANDLFFSGHTAIAVYGGLQLYHTGPPIFMALGIFIALFEATTVLILRAHWTMDVFAGALAAIMVDQFIQQSNASIDSLLTIFS